MDEDWQLQDSTAIDTMVSRCARRFERCCCSCVTFFPLVFVYGLASWAMWSLASLCSVQSKVTWLGPTAAAMGFVLYCMLSWAYTAAVFTDPGSTTGGYAVAKRGSGYSFLPTDAPPRATSFTVKSNGEIRFCKKCHTRKPDRAHHCSTCGRCVLKMDHHCPWLATCVGLRNHKSFLLFLIYTSLFCLYCFTASASWVYVEVLEAAPDFFPDSVMPGNYIVLVVVSGVIGLVLTGFTSWHIYLATKGQTTIECLEKTRYLTPMRNQMRANIAAAHSGHNSPGYGQQLFEIHANALPGVTRPEEGEDVRSETSGTPLARSHSRNAMPLRMTYEEWDEYRARRRQEEELVEADSQKLPHAFDLGSRKNLLHLFGDRWYMWPLPICTTTGNGWSWEPNPQWVEARDRFVWEQEEQYRQWEQENGQGASAGREGTAAWGSEAPPWPNTLSGAENTYNGSAVTCHSPYDPNWRSPHEVSSNRLAGSRSPSKADRVLGRDPNLYVDVVQPTSGRSRRTDELDGVGLRDLGVEAADNMRDVDDFMDEEEEAFARTNKGSVLVPIRTAGSKTTTATTLAPTNSVPRSMQASAHNTLTHAHDAGARNSNAGSSGRSSPQLSSRDAIKGLSLQRGVGAVASPGSTGASSWLLRRSSNLHAAGVGGTRTPSPTTSVTGAAASKPANASRNQGSSQPLNNVNKSLVAGSVATSPSAVQAPILMKTVGQPEKKHTNHKEPPPSSYKDNDMRDDDDTNEGREHEGEEEAEEEEEDDDDDDAEHPTVHDDVVTASCKPGCVGQPSPLVSKDEDGDDDEVD